MRILIASRGVVRIEPGCGGAEMVVYQLARSIATRGHDVTLVADLNEEEFGVTPRLRVVPERSRIQGRVRRLPGGLPRWLAQHLIGNIAVARTVRCLVRSGEAFDVIHAHGALSAILISIGARTPIVYTEHDATPWSCRYRTWHERAIRRLVFRAVNVTAFRRADAVVTCFETQAAELRERWGIPERKVSCIANGTDPALFDPPQGEAVDLERRVAFERYCLFVGSLIPRKSPDLLLEAVAEAGDLPCVFAGEGPLRHKLERRAAELGIEDRVAFLGNVPPRELRRLYGEADMLVLPSFSEGTPLVVLEAMTCGTPILATRIAGLPNLVEDWETGFLVKPGDVGQLAMGIRFLAGDATLRSRMGKAGRTRVLRGFPWQAVAGRYLSLYDGSQARPVPESRRRALLEPA